MRDLVLLRGAAGCGKSTWIENNNLSQYTIEADKIRLLFQSPILTVDGGLTISQKNDGKVWEFIFQLMAERMERGELTIIDATHSRVDLINRYKKLCQEYRYRCTVIKFDVLPEEIIKRNANRNNYKFVPEEAIRNMCARIDTQPTPNWCDEISPEQFSQKFIEIRPPMDLSKYENIVHFGDLHGCLQPLQKYFDENPFSDRNYYIFLGDYIDRGIQNRELLDFIIPLALNNKNVVVLEGNHERWLRFWADENYEAIRSREFTRYTKSQLEELDKKEVRQFCRRLWQMVYYQYNNSIVFCNHGGLPIMPNSLVATEELIKGVGKYEEYKRVSEVWKDNYHGQNLFQVYGHRNTENSPIKMNDHVFNLCDTVEFGGYLRVLTLNETGFHTDMYKNDTFFINESPPPTVRIEDKKALVEGLFAHKFVYTKKMSNPNIYSINFTRTAFYDKKWDEFTIKARGLFLNRETGNIVARSYEKFFNIGERDEVKTNVLRRTLVFPANVYLKYNGYLGIVGYDDENDSLFIASKTSDRGPFKEWFQEILLKNHDELVLKDFVKSKNVSLIFEVIDPINDPHIIEYEDKKIVLLDVIDRTLEFNRSLDVYDVGKELNFEVKEFCLTLNDYNEFYQFYIDTEKNDYQYNGQYVEGFVIEDSNHFMVKQKTNYYSFWKNMRGLLQTLSKGHQTRLSWLTTPEQNYVYAFMKEKGREWLQERNIIQIRNAMNNN